MMFWSSNIDMTRSLFILSKPGNCWWGVWIRQRHHIPTIQYLGEGCPCKDELQEFCAAFGSISVVSSLIKCLGTKELKQVENNSTNFPSFISVFHKCFLWGLTLFVLFQYVSITNVLRYVAGHWCLWQRLSVASSNQSLAPDGLRYLTQCPG